MMQQDSREDKFTIVTVDTIYACFCFEVLGYLFRGISGGEVPMGNLNGQLLALAFWNAFQLSTDQRSFAELSCCSNLRTHQMADIVPQLVDWLGFSHMLPRPSSHFPSPHLRNLQLVQSYSGTWLLVDVVYCLLMFVLQCKIASICQRPKVVLRVQQDKFEGFICY